MVCLGRQTNTHTYTHSKRFYIQNIAKVRETGQDKRGARVLAWPQN